MSSPRLRRLMADFNAVRAEYSGHERVTISTEGPPPPQIYQVEIRVPGMRLVDGQPEIVHSHEIEIRLPLGYPREPPYCIARTPVFHPNVDRHYCIGDYWAAGQSLVDVIAQLADMLQYRGGQAAYNPASPLNVAAARYAVQNPGLFPLAEINVYQPELEISLKS